MPFRRSRKPGLFATAGVGSTCGPLLSPTHCQPDDAEEAEVTTTTTTTTTTPAPGAPGAPEDFLIDSTTPTSITLSWSPPLDTGSSPIDHYPIEYQDGIGAWVEFEQEDNVTGVVTVTGLSKGHNYNFRIYARNASGVGPANTDAVGATDTTAPGAPTDLAAGEVSFDSVELTWEHNIDDGGDPPTDSLVQYKESSSGEWLEYSHAFLNGATTVTVSGLDSVVSYDFRVSDINDSNGAGDFSTPLTDIFTLGAP